MILARNNLDLSTPTRIAVDAMGGDYGPQIIVPAVLDSLLKDSQLRILLFGDKQNIEKFLPTSPVRCLYDRLDIINCMCAVESSDNPIDVIRNKQDSSLCQSIMALSQGDADACVSAGSTGALLMQSMRLIETLPGVKRPAICASVPTYHGNVSLLDLGANLKCDANNFHQFGVLASMKCNLVDGIENPSIKLLNIGEEVNKGTKELKAAAELFNEDKNLNYQGFIEGNNLLTDPVDVIICDGFTGNVALKTAEGVARLAMGIGADIVRENLSLRLLSKLFTKSLNEFKSRLSPTQHNGAIFLGLNRIVVKSHGSARKDGFENAIGKANLYAKRNIINLLQPKLAKYSWMR